MAFTKGQVANPLGAGKSSARRALSKIQGALDKSIDMLGIDTTAGCGATELARLITVKLKEDPIGTMKALSSILPKDLNVDVQHTNAARSLSDDELADIIATRARIKHIESNTIDGDCKIISTESTGCEVKQGKKGGV